MIITNRLFDRQIPSREAKSIYIFCEGIKREYQYFEYFKEIGSRINVEIYELKSTQDNSPSGLLDIAKSCVIKTEENPNPKYTFQKNDEVWIVLDIDPDKTHSRPPQIQGIQNEIDSYIGWNMCLSNPCFEVWLYYHLTSSLPIFDGMNLCKNWKPFLNNIVPGGFDSRKHPILIEDAIENDGRDFYSNKDIPEVGSTEVFLLAKSIFEVAQNKIRNVRTETDL